MNHSEQVLNHKQSNRDFIGDRRAAKKVILHTPRHTANEMVSTKRLVKSILHQWIAVLMRPIRFLRKVDFSNNRIHRCDPSLRAIHDYHFYGYIPLDRK